MKRFLRVTALASTLLIGKTMTAASEPKILFEEDPTLLITTVEVVITSGAADDPIDKAGLSSLLSDIIVRGTKKKSRTKFQSELEKLGASIGSRAGIDSIVISGRVIKENTPAFLKLLTECLLEPAFSETEFEALKKEQLGEIAHRKNNNSRLAGLAIRKEAFKGSPLARSAEGGLETVSKIKLDDLKRAYNDRFHQGNVVFALSSPTPEKELKKSLVDIWKALPDGLRRDRRSLKVNIPSQPVLIVVDKPKTSTGSLIMAQTGITAKDENRHALMMSNEAFGGAPFISRLFKVIRGELGWTYAIGSTYYAMGGLGHQQGLFVVSGTPSIEFTVKAILKSMSMFDEYAKSGVRGEELLLVKDSMINTYPFEFDSAEKRLSQKLYSYLYGVPVLSPEDYAAKLNSYSQKELVDLVGKHHNGQGWLIGITADAKEIAKQLEEEQKEIPADQRIKISKVLKPEEVIN